MQPLSRRHLIALGMAAATPKALAQRDAKTLTVASFPSFDEAVKAAIPLYKNVAPDVTLKLVSLSYADHHNAIITALATHTGTADVLGIELDYLGKMIQSGGLEDISKPPYNAGRLRSRVVRSTIAQASRKDGSLAAMPVDLGPGSLFYRHDILAKAGVSEAELVASWDSYIEAGKRIKAKTGALLVPNAATMFNVVIRSNLKDGDGVYFDKSDNPLLTTPRFVRAFELSRTVRKANLDGRFEPFTTEWNEGFKRGSFATEMRGAWLAGHLARYMAPESAGLWRAAPLPNGAYASWGGSFYAIPKTLAPERKLMAWQFIEFMASNKAMQVLAFKQVDAYPALLEAATDPFIDEGVPYLGGQKARQLWRVAANNIPATEVNKFDPIAAEILAGELDKVMELGKSIPVALAHAQRKVERRLRR